MTGRDREDYAANASKRHKLVGQVLSEGAFRTYRIFQEVPIVDINPAYYNRRTRADWYIPDLHVVVEVHGEDHRQWIDRGNEGKHRAKLKFVRRQHLDVEKVMALADVGIGTVEVWPEDEISEENLLKLISDTMKQMTCPVKKTMGPRERAKKQASKYRREQYQLAKQRAREQKRD